MGRISAAPHEFCSEHGEEPPREAPCIFIERGGSEYNYFEYLINLRMVIAAKTPAK